MVEGPVADFQAISEEHSLHRVAQLLPWAMALTAASFLLLLLFPLPANLDTALLSPLSRHLGHRASDFALAHLYRLQQISQLAFLGWGGISWFAIRMALGSPRWRSSVLRAIHVIVLVQCAIASLIENLQGPGLFGIALGCYVVPGVLTLTPRRYRITTGIFLVSILALILAAHWDLMVFVFFAVKVATLGILAMVLQEHLYRAQLKVFGRLQDLHARNTELDSKASRDPLTGLANRRAFAAALASAWDQARVEGKPLSLISADIDFFKRINDTMGHGFGDTVLKEVAQHLLTPVRQSDLVARMGGEEFLLLLPDAPAQAALAIAERLRAGLTGLPCAGQYDAPITASFGVATSDEAKTSEALLHLVDERLYQAKRSGRDRVVGPAQEPEASGP